jgi:L-alanine-DL-glutamate epimerase-like enolase superfamily enzyme
MADLEVSAFTIPTEEPESDGTLEWDATTMVLVEVGAGGQRGLGYTYGSPAIAAFIREHLGSAVEGADPLSPPRTWAAMQEAIRNAGQPGLGAMAVSAVDVALWDLKAKLLGVCLADALPRVHARVPVYGSGGFTSLSLDRLQEQLAGWAHLGRVKMKVGREPARDPDRLRAAREAIGDGVELFVDANGAFTPKQAVRQARRYADFGVTYLEEPVTSDDLPGLRLVRDGTELDVAAGEYAWSLADVEPLLDAVDVVQADVTRVGGITVMLRVDGLCKARSMPFSAHCAPAISAHVCCAMETAAHIEYFQDHVRVERLLFDGTLDPRGGALEPDRSRPGLGLELRRSDAARYAA